eukprot:scaffold424933_cov27-Prasinocladus_malaysianus.AAC.1
MHMILHCGGVNAAWAAWRRLAARRAQSPMTAASSNVRRQMNPQDASAGLSNRVKLSNLFGGRPDRSGFSCATSAAVE